MFTCEWERHNNDNCYDRFVCTIQIEKVGKYRILIFSLWFTIVISSISIYENLLRFLPCPDLTKRL